MRRAISIVAGLTLVALELTTSPVAAQRPAARFLAFEAVVQGSGDAELRWPVAVAAGSAFQLAVVDAYGERLVLFAETGRGVADAETEGRSAGGIGWAAAGVVKLPATPLAVVFDGRRYVVAMRGHDELLTVPLLRSAHLESDSSPGSLALPDDTWVGALAATANGELLVYDTGDGRVLTLDDAGRPVRETALDERITSLAATPDGGFYAALAEQSRILRYLTSGGVFSNWRIAGDGPVPAWPNGLVVEPSGRLLVADRHGGRVLALDGAGNLTGVGSASGWRPGRLRFPSGMARLPDGRLAVTDRGNGRVQIFRSFLDADTLP